MVIWGQSFLRSKDRALMSLGENAGCEESPVEQLGWSRRSKGRQVEDKTGKRHGGEAQRG